jgi:hypothetical protein
MEGIMSFRLFILSLYAMVCFTAVSFGEGKWTNYTKADGLV